MDNKDEYRSVERLYIQDWLLDQIQVTNFELVDHMKLMLQQDGRFNEVFQVERKEIEHLKHNQSSLRNLLRTPFLMVEPTLQTVEDWRCFVDETPTTLTVDILRRKTPELDSLGNYAVGNSNRLFLSLVTQVIHMSVLCAPLLGITNELAQYLASVPPWKLHFALGRMKGLPLFRWRFNSPTFWYEFAASSLTDETIAHQIMLTSPIRSGDLPLIAGWSELRLERARNEIYAAAMMAHGLRASTASTLFRLRTWQWWRQVILPGILPYYVTGALTATGGSWNASIVAEVASWGDTRLEAAGLGSCIADASAAGDYPRVVLGIGIMSVMVVACNRLVWRPLYRLAERRFRLD